MDLLKRIRTEAYLGRKPFVRLTHSLHVKGPVYMTCDTVGCCRHVIQSTVEKNGPYGFIMIGRLGCCDALQECINVFPHIDTFWRSWETSLLKILWEKEKLLVTSNFSFFHSVFNSFGLTFCHFCQICNCRLQTL